MEFFLFIFDMLRVSQIYRCRGKGGGREEEEEEEGKALLNDESPRIWKETETETEKPKPRNTCLWVGGGRRAVGERMAISSHCATRHPHREPPVAQTTAQMSFRFSFPTRSIHQFQNVLQEHHEENSNSSIDADQCNKREYLVDETAVDLIQLGHSTQLTIQTVVARQ